MTDLVTYDFDNIGVKRGVLEHLAKLTGLIDILVRPRRRTRTLKANAYWWSAIIGPWSEWFRAYADKPWLSKEDCHEALVGILRGTETVKTPSGFEVTVRRVHTKDLPKEDFGELITEATLFLLYECNVIVLAPELYYDSKKETKDEN